jgi:hypothetical protein
MLIVSTAVYMGLDRLNPGFTLMHWAGLIDYTHLFKVAIDYVFEKQSTIVSILNSFFMEFHRNK